MTNGVAPSSSDNATDVKLSPGSSTGQTGMDMPKTPGHKTWNGDMGSNRAKTQPTQWLALMKETLIDIYAMINIELKDERVS